MSTHTTARPQKFFSRFKKPLVPMPNFVQPQLDSFKWLVEKGLKEIFEEFSSIKDYSEKKFQLDFTGFDGLITALCSWGDPDSHPNAPSIGLFNDIGVTAQLPQAYSGAWKVSAAQAIATAMGQYNAIKPVPAICPVNDQGDNLLAFALAAKAAGCAGISAWRHGANGVSPASFAGVAEVFAPPAPTPTPTPTPAPAPSEQVLVAGTPYQTPKGDTITIS